MVVLWAAAVGARGQGFLLGPQIISVEMDATGRLVVAADVPPGFRHVLLESSAGSLSGDWEPCVSGPLTGAAAHVVFRVPPSPAPSAFFRINAGTSTTVPEAPHGGPETLSVIYGEGGEFLASDLQYGHVLNRIAYGPSTDDLTMAVTIGLPAYIEQQLDPASIDEASNAPLGALTEELFYDYLPYTGTPLVAEGAVASYLKGIAAPPTDWHTLGFDDSGWATGPTGIGYGDDDDATVLDDMPRSDTSPGYLTYFVRLHFPVADISAIDNLILDLRYDDAFVAYLNGEEVARSENLPAGAFPAFDLAASPSGGNVDNGGERYFNLTSHKTLLVEGDNVLAIQIHNQGLSSSDASCIPALVAAPASPYRAIRGIDGLKQLLHVRGVYARRQLQAVLGEFWENHFTTDYDKVEDYLGDLDSFEDLADLTDEDAVELQVETEAAAIEHAEYEFFHDNALGNFGDLLLYSATSPAMLIYLDNVLNVRGAPNENYAREILELSAFGVDNGYTQQDIEQLAKAFTGWTVRKVRVGDKLPFPDSARTPPTDDSIAVEGDDALLELGAPVVYLKGYGEPSPDPASGEPTTAWTRDDFNDTGWLPGITPLGYGEPFPLGTELEDMRNNYSSVYLRVNVALPDPTTVDDLVLEIDFDDGYVAYLNGTEISRSRTMRNAASPPAFDSLTSGGGNHNSGVGDPDVVSLAPFAHLMKGDGSDILAIQAHNTSLGGSSDFSILPRVLVRSYTEASIAETDPAGLWTFRFDPDEHFTDEAVTLFAGTPYEIVVAPGNTGPAGVNDAIGVIDALVEHPACAQFICTKLVNRFVSDGITLDTYQARTAPDYLLAAVDQAVAAWNSTSPKGNIATVMRAILDPQNQMTAFWREESRFAKIKTPLEFINSAFRGLGADITDPEFRLRYRLDDMGQDYFTRDDPDGWPEAGPAWVSTLGLLERMRFAQGIGSNLTFSYGTWDLAALIADNGLTTAEELVDYFDDFLFQGSLTAERRAVILDFANTDDAGEPSPLDGLTGNARSRRLHETVGFLLASPEFHFQ